MEKAIRGRYRIVKMEAVSKDVFELCLEAPEIAAAAGPGQFVNIYLPDSSALLPRPISIAAAQGHMLTLIFAVVGKGTAALAGLAPGASLEIMGPLGTGFFDYAGSLADAGFVRKDEDSLRVLLIGGGVGIPPLYFAARRLRALFGGSVQLSACLGFREYPWYTEAFALVCDEVRTASETEGAAMHHGNVLDALGQMGSGPEGVELALACGPRPMLAAVSAWCAARETPLRVSLEERMGCGYGACAGCIAKTKALHDVSKPQSGPNNPDTEGVIRKKVCVHGPVFWADEVIW